MRGLILIVAIVLLLALVGWISFSSNPGRTSINVETDQIKHDTDQMVESGAELLHKAERKVDSSTTANGQPATTPPANERFVPDHSQPQPSAAQDSPRTATAPPPASRD